MWIEREYSDRVRAIAAQRPVLVLTGARQTGKSSLLRRLFPDHHYVSLDLPSDAALAEHDPQAFLRQHPPPLIVDEVQYAPGIFRHLKLVVDSARDRRGDILLTGSQRFVLMQAISESLAGRAAILELETLSFEEVRSVAPQTRFETFIVRGGYPELWADRSIEATSFYRSYVATYLERDLQRQLRVTDLRDFERFLRACALRSGQLLNKSDLARDIGISVPTVTAWLGVLQASGIVALLEPWFANPGKSAVKTPKLYFRDTGLLCFLVNLRSEDELERSPLRGHLFETAIHAELSRALGLGDERESLFFLRERTTEVDFIIHRGGAFTLIEAKWTEVPEDKDAASLRRARASLGIERVTQTVLVARAPAPHPLRSDASIAVWNPSVMAARVARPT